MERREVNKKVIAVHRQPLLAAHEGEHAARIHAFAGIRCCSLGLRHNKIASALCDPGCAANRQRLFLKPLMRE